MDADLKARALATHLDPYAPGLRHESLVNPDGPELVEEIERLEARLRYEQHRAERIGTHGSGCWKWGPSHWECAVEEVGRATGIIRRYRAGPSTEALDDIADAFLTSIGGQDD